MMPKSENIELVIPEQFKELFQPSQQWRHLIYKGGRSSGNYYDIDEVKHDT